MSQNIIITGGASGIGYRMAQRFAERGDKIAICDLNENFVQKVKAEHPDWIASFCNVTDEQQMENFFAEVSNEWDNKIDVLCANAGTAGPAGSIDTLDYQSWKSCIEINLCGVFLACKFAIKAMRQNSKGVILIISSTSGLHGVPFRSPYVTAKWGLVGLTKTLAMELGSIGIRVNALAPGAVEGERMERVVEAEAEAVGKTSEDIRNLYAQGVSLRNWVSADDVADMALFIASSKASKITGQILAIDGHTERMV
jgi:NAD(P)-dependent dehydrogenase (short-subunit alcohol dehydrogenase family)